MIYSNERKLCLSGWLLLNNPSVYENPLKMQKFLFLYECLSKTDGESADFSHLRGYKRGPVFSNVWGDYTKERQNFNQKAREALFVDSSSINSVRAIKSNFIVSVLNEEDLSELTHSLNIWSSKKDRIMGGEYQVDLHETDFNAHDEYVIKQLDSMYPINMILNSSLITIGKSCFLFNKNDIPKLTETHIDILSVLSENENLHNPVYVNIDTTGGLLID